MVDPSEKENAVHAGQEAPLPDPAEKENAPYHPQQDALSEPAQPDGLDRKNTEAAPPHRLDSQTPQADPPAAPQPAEDEEDAISFKRKSGSDQKMRLQLPSAQSKGIIAEEPSGQQLSTGKKSPAPHALQTENVFYAGSTPKEQLLKSELLPAAEHRSGQKVNTGASDRKTL